MSGPTEIKNYSLDNIFNNDSKKIKGRLTKGYLCRREITELLDHINKESTVRLALDEAGGFEWKIGGETLNTNQKTNNIPFWMRRISHWFNLKLPSTCEQSLS